MVDRPARPAAERIDAALTGLAELAGPGTENGDLLALLTLCEAAARRNDRLLVGALAEVERRGVFVERGYCSSAAALGRFGGMGPRRGPASAGRRTAGPAPARAG